jgi:predicted phosphodiesterase
MAGGGAAGASNQPVLLGAPLLFNPTASSFGINVVAFGELSEVFARVRIEGDPEFGPALSPELRADDALEWTVTGLSPSTRYEYEIFQDGAEARRTLFTGALRTARPAGESYSFAVVTDTHIPPREVAPGEVTTINSFEETMAFVANDIATAEPEFIVSLGDVLDFHMFGFNVPPPDKSWTRLGYLNYRRLYGDILGSAPHFNVVGNWDGENGCNTEEEIERSRSQRLLYIPGPEPETYPEGGSELEDYYAFTWGDALFIVLNVMTYTPTCHDLGINPGVPDDWTLGEAQLDFLRQKLESATSKWRFIMIHHAVGGAAGDLANSAYGRGGGQAARVGEQSVVHDLMLEYGVQIFFYGHDHVFTNMIVDGIHYMLPGSAGAPWKFEKLETGYTQYWTDSGYARVNVSPEAVDVDFVSMGGVVLESYKLE